MFLLNHRICFKDASDCLAIVSRQILFQAIATVCLGFYVRKKCTGHTDILLLNTLFVRLLFDVRVSKFLVRKQFCSHKSLQSPHKSQIFGQEPIR